MHCASLQSPHVLLCRPLIQISRKHTRVPSIFIFLQNPNFPKIRITKKIPSIKCCRSSGMELGFEEGSQGLNLGDKDAVIIVDHGSRRQESNLMLNEFVAMFKSRTGFNVVEPAHMELAEPSIKEAFKLCVQQGATRVIISPFFLFPGRHWHQDIPALTAEAAKDHSGVSYIITAPLGLHELMVDVMTDRIKQCLSHVAGTAEECAICAGTGRCRVYGS